MEAIKEDCKVSGLHDIKWMWRLLRCGRLEGKQVSKGGGADNKFMLVYLEIYSLRKKKVRTWPLFLFSLIGRRQLASAFPCIHGENMIHFVLTRVIRTI